MKKLIPIVSLFLLVAAVFWSIYGTMPQEAQLQEVPATQFSTKRAFRHVKNIAEAPHHVGSAYHSEVRNYIVNELQELGLFVQTQSGYALNDEGVITRPQNILARIEGTGEGKALLLLTHYDSAMHSSYGASDAASGVATILEGVRAFLASGKKPENDIIILFTDAEELGLNGAELFVDGHDWSKEVGLALNFESRGSGGNSFMLLETTSGNAELIENFIAANSEYPVTNSLAYSIYKMLPNDTDLTVLREQGNINGFNFAFIDDHFDYHTATDVPENLDLNTLAHQGSYLMPLLEYFSSADLSNLENEADKIYFNFPIVKMLSYPFAWILPLLFVGFAIFIGLLFLGFKKGKLNTKAVIKGFVPLLVSLVAAGVGGYLFWQFCLLIYPQYSEMEHGFTYNGYYYIAFTIFFALAVAFFSYRKYVREIAPASLFVAPLVLWFLLCAAAAFWLKGASYFIIPFLFGVVQLFFLLKQKKPNLILLSLLSLPAIFIIMPFMRSFPVALGLKMLFLAAVLCIFLFTLLLPVFSLLKKFKGFGILCWIVAFVLFLVAHFQSDFSLERPKPNSLVYMLDSDGGEAHWYTYDKLLDPWTEKFITSEAKEVEDQKIFSSKYNSGFTYKASAAVKDIPQPKIFLSKNDSAKAGSIFYNLKIAPQRDINRIDLFADKDFDFQSISVNGLQPSSQEGKEFHIFTNRKTENLLTYYAVNRDTLRLKIEVKEGQYPQLMMFETSHNLIDHNGFNVKKRPEGMIPKPFVINDAVIVKKKIELK